MTRDEIFEDFKSLWSSNSERTVEDLAGEFGVSERTIYRWKKQLA